MLPSDAKPLHLEHYPKWNTFSISCNESTLGIELQRREALLLYHYICKTTV